MFEIITPDEIISDKIEYIKEKSGKDEIVIVISKNKKLENDKNIKQALELINQNKTPIFESESGFIMFKLNKKNMKTDFRPWGFYTVISEKEGYLTKIIHVNKGQKLSVQSHNHRSEYWIVLSGIAKVLLNGHESILKPQQSISIKVKDIHSLQNPFDEDLEIIEIQKGDILSEEDIIRYEDMYGRI